MCPLRWEPKAKKQHQQDWFVSTAACTSKGWIAPKACRRTTGRTCCNIKSVTNTDKHHLKNMSKELTASSQNHVSNECPCKWGERSAVQVLGFAFGLLKHFFKSAWPWEMKSFGFWSLWHSHQRQQTVALPLQGRFQIQRPKSILVLCFRSLAAREVGKGWHMMAWWEGYEDYEDSMKTLWHGPNSHFKVHRGTGCCQTHRKPASPPSQPWIHEL